MNSDDSVDYFSLFSYLIFTMGKLERINGIYKALLKRYGPQGWWPAETALECVIGSILAQNTNWLNVEKAVKNLKNENLISVERLSLIPTSELARLIRPSGYFNQKAKRIKRFVRFVEDNYSGSLQDMFGEETYSLREKLLGVKGIGPETADTILLYAGDKPVFVVDAYTYRILSRHQLIPEETTYDEMQDVFTDLLPQDAKLFGEYHALLVKVGKEHCKKRNPICKGCPLEYDPHTV